MSVIFASFTCLATISGKKSYSKTILIFRTKRHVAMGGCSTGSDKNTKLLEKSNFSTMNLAWKNRSNLSPHPMLWYLLAKNITVSAPFEETFKANFITHLAW